MSDDLFDKIHKCHDLVYKWHNHTPADIKHVGYDEGVQMLEDFAHLFGAKLGVKIILPEDKE